MTVDTVAAPGRPDTSDTPSGAFDPSADTESARLPVDTDATGADLTDDAASETGPATDGTDSSGLGDESGDAATPAAAPAPAVAEKPKRAAAKKAPAKKTKTLELTLTVTGTADGEWKAELKQGNSYLAKNLLVAAAAVSRAAKELHDDLSAPIDAVIDAAREQQAAKVAALEAELEAARRALAELDD